MHLFFEYVNKNFSIWFYFWFRGQSIEGEGGFRESEGVQKVRQLWGETLIIMRINKEVYFAMWLHPSFHWLCLQPFGFFESSLIHPFRPTKLPSGSWWLPVINIFHVCHKTFSFQFVCLQNNRRFLFFLCLLTWLASMKHTKK